MIKIKNSLYFIAFKLRTTFISLFLINLVSVPVAESTQIVRLQGKVKKMKKSSFIFNSFDRDLEIELKESPWVDQNSEMKKMLKVGDRIYIHAYEYINEKGLNKLNFISLSEKL